MSPSWACDVNLDNQVSTIGCRWLRSELGHVVDEAHALDQFTESLDCGDPGLLPVAWVMRRLPTAVEE
jgi:hypothetical protein